MAKTKFLWEMKSLFFGEFTNHPLIESNKGISLIMNN